MGERYEKYEEQNVPVLLRYRSSKTFIVMTICVASFTVSRIRIEPDLLDLANRGFPRTHVSMAWSVLKSKSLEKEEIDACRLFQFSQFH